MALKATSDNKKMSRTAQGVVERFQASWDYQRQNHHSRWDRNYKLYNNKRWDPGYKGISNTFVPMVFPTVETATAAMCSGKPSIDFLPQDMYRYIRSYYEVGAKPDVKALNALFDYYWECDNWDKATIYLVRMGFLYGTGTEWIYWDGDKPRIIPLHPRDAIIDPRLSDPMQLITHPKDYYSGRRYFTKLSALEDEQIVDPDTGELVRRFKNLSKVVPGIADTSEGGKADKEQFLGSIGPTEDLVEVIEIWDGERIRSVAQRAVDIEDRVNELGIHCLNIHRFIADENIVHGKSIVDPIALEQELLNDVTNQSVDAVSEQLIPQWEMDPAFADHIPKVTNAFGTVYPFTPGTLKQIQKNPVSPQAFNERQNMKNEMREATGIDQIVNGVGEDSSATATEINAQLNQAGQRFTLYVRMLEREGLYHRAKIVYRMMLHYISDMQLVPTNTMDGPKFYPFNPEQFDDSWEPKISLESSVRSNKMRTAEEATAAYTAIIADPTNDLWEAKKIMYPKMFDLNEEELDKIIGPEKPQEFAGAPTEPLSEELPPEAVEPVIEPVEEPAEAVDPDAEGNARLEAALAQLGVA